MKNCSLKVINLFLCLLYSSISFCADGIPGLGTATLNDKEKKAIRFIARHELDNVIDMKLRSFINATKLIDEIKSTVPRVATYVLSTGSLTSKKPPINADVDTPVYRLELAIMNNDEKSTQELLNEKVNPNEIENITGLALPSFSICQKLLSNEKNPLDATKFLQWVLHRKFQKDNQFTINEEALVNLALSNGADPNDPSIYRCILTDLVSYKNEEGIFKKIVSIDLKTIKLLFDNSYKKINPDKFCQYIVSKLSSRSINKFITINPEEILKAKYKNLSILYQPSLNSEPQIPLIIHHIWVTNDKVRREISAENMYNILETNKLFKNSKYQWRLIVWINDRNLIPGSVKELEKNGIEVMEIATIKDQLSLYNKTNELIAQGAWGMASDILRYEILKLMGGIYADIDALFLKEPIEEVNKYDLFAQVTSITQNPYDIQNGFIGTKANHPVIIKTIELAKNNLNNLAFFNSDNTLEATYFPFGLAYFINGNNKTTDVVFTEQNYIPTPDFIFNASLFELLEHYCGSSHYKYALSIYKENINAFISLVKNEICTVNSVVIDSKQCTWCN